MRREGGAVLGTTHHPCPRLEALDLICRLSWPGTIAAAVYVPLWSSRVHTNVTPSFDGLAAPAALAALEQFHRQLQDAQSGGMHTAYACTQCAVIIHGCAGSCALDMDVYKEDLMELSDWYTYPVNSMRNRALAMATTDVRHGSVWDYFGV